MLYKASRLKDNVHTNKGNVTRELTSSGKLNVKQNRTYSLGVNV